MVDLRLQGLNPLFWCHSFDLFFWLTSIPEYLEHVCVIINSYLLLSLQVICCVQALTEPLNNGGCFCWKLIPTEVNPNENLKAGIAGSPISLLSKAAHVPQRSFDRSLQDRSIWRIIELFKPVFLSASPRVLTLFQDVAQRQTLLEWTFPVPPWMILLLRQEEISPLAWYYWI